MEIIHRAKRQAPGPDGIRRSRWGVIRNTYPELKSTTIKTWTEWARESWYGPVVYDSPIRHQLWLDAETYLEVFFTSIDKETDIRKLLSLDLTGLWLNEARELPKSALDMGTSRVGRYPPMRDGGPTWSGVIMDTNSMDDSHWWYLLAEEMDKEELLAVFADLIARKLYTEAQVLSLFKFYAQPGALSTEAENLDNLPADYYARQMAGKDKWWIDLHIHNKYGPQRGGKPVYEHDWDDDFHISPVPLLPIRHREIILGWDFGLTPACIIAQATPIGQLRILEEVIGDNIAIDRFARDAVVPLLRTKYADNTFTSVGDPSGVGRKDTDANTVFNELSNADLPTRPARSNALEPRLGAVRWWLNRSRGRTPFFVIDKRCKVLRKGFNGGYSYRRIAQIGGGFRYADTGPDKNEYSHPHDALQYLCMELQPDSAQRNKDHRRDYHKPALVTGVADAITGY